MVRHGLVNIREWSGIRTPGVQGTTGPPSLVYFVHTQRIIELFRSDFEEPYKFVKEVHENVVCCRLFAMAQ